MGEHKFSWHDWAWKISFQSIYASIHGNHSSNLHALISLPETVLPSNPGTKMPPCDFPAQSRPTDALKNSNIFQGMFATHSLKKENHPQIHVVAQHHDCIQGGFLIGISQAKISTPTTKKKKTLRTKYFRHNFLNILHSKFLLCFLKCFTLCYRDVLTGHQCTGRNMALLNPVFPKAGRSSPASTRDLLPPLQPLPCSVQWSKGWGGGERALNKD